MNNNATDPKDLQEEIAASDEVVAEAEAVTKPQKKTAGKSNRRRLRMGSASLAVTVIVIVGVLLLNIAFSVLADKFPITLDLSEDQVFTMTDASVAIAEGATTDIEIIIFTSETYLSNCTSGAENEIPEFDTTMKEFYNILKQYKTHSGGKITYKFIDPVQDPALYAQYSDYSVNYGSVLMMAADGRTKTMTVDDLYDLDTSNYSTTGTYVFESKVEKVIGSAVRTLCGADETLIQILVGHEEDTNTISGIKSVYGVNGYNFEELSIIGSADFNKDAEIALIAAPAADYTKEEINRLQAWMYNNGNYGRHLMVYINPIADCPNLYEFLEVEYQIRVEDEIIYETDNARIFNYNGYMSMADIPTTDITTDSASTAKLMIPETRRLTTILGDKNQEASVSTYGVALTTHPDSAMVALLEKLDDENASEEEVFKTPKDEEYPLTSTIMYVSEGYNNTTEEETYSTVMVCGSPMVAYETYVKSTTYVNEEFLLETVSAMASTESAVIITTKNLSEEYVVFDGTTQLVLGIGVFTFGIPAVLVIICLVVFIRRKNL